MNIFIGYNIEKGACIERAIEGINTCIRTSRFLYVLLKFYNTIHKISAAINCRYSQFFSTYGLMPNNQSMQWAEHWETLKITNYSKGIFLCILHIFLYC